MLIEEAEGKELSVSSIHLKPFIINACPLAPVLAPFLVCYECNVGVCKRNLPFHVLFEVWFTKHLVVEVKAPPSHARVRELLVALERLVLATLRHVKIPAAHQFMMWTMHR